MSYRIGLTGAHRVGKSTLAEVLAKDTKAKYAPVGISDMQAAYGYDSSKQDYPWEERKKIQELLLGEFSNQLLGLRVYHVEPVNRPLKITDRTPLDLVGYAMWSFPDNATKEDTAWLENYIQLCIELTNRNYRGIALVQPGIPLVSSPTSAPADAEMIETFNQCYLSLFLDPRLRIKKFIIPRELIDVDRRSLAVRSALL